MMMMMMMMMRPSVKKWKHSLGNVRSPLCPLMATFGELLNEVGGLEYIYFRAFIMILGPLLVNVHRIITLPVKNVHPIQKISFDILERHSPLCGDGG